MTFHHLLLLPTVLFTTTYGFLQQNSPNMGGGNIFDSFLQSLGFAPTTSPYMDPFSSNYGQENTLGGMSPLMMADIDIADRISGIADARAAKRESMQGREQKTRMTEQRTSRRQLPGRFERRNLGPQRPSSSWYQKPVRNESPPWSNMLKSSSQQPSSVTKKPPEWNTKHQRPVAEQKTSLTTPKPSTSLLPQHEINKLRLSQVLRPSPRQQFKDIARSAISANETPPSTIKKSNFRNSRSRLNRRRPPPRRPRIDPDLMSDMMDMAGDFGMMGLLMNSMSGRGSRCNYSMAAMMEFMMTGRCGYGMFG